MINGRRKRSQRFTRLAALAVVLGIASPAASAATVRLTVENVGPAGTTFVTPIFAAFHDGSYSLASGGGAATPGLESLAELGMTGQITSEFTSGDVSRVAGTLGGGPIAPSQVVSSLFTLDLASGANTRLTLATMILPSSDLFLGNISTPAFDLSGLALGETREFTLSAIYDAGTELNDFATSPGNPLLGLPAGDAMLSVPDTIGTVRLVTGNPFADFLNSPVGGFNPTLSSLRVRVTAIPEPSSMIAGCVLVAGAVMRRRWKKAASC